MRASLAPVLRRGQVAGLPMSSPEKSFSRWMSQRELKALAKSPGPIALGHVPGSAQAFVLAALAREAPKRAFLALTGSVKTQDELANDLEGWAAPYLFLPQGDLAAAGETLSDPETVAERLAALHQLGAGFTGIALATTRAAEQPLPSPKLLAGHRFALVKNAHLDRDDLLARLEKAGYTREAQVQGRGQFSVRGAVIDIFSWDARRPLRTEWEDEELISLREFDVDAQSSVQTLKTAEITLAGPGVAEESGATLRDFLPRGFVEVNLGAEEEETPVRPGDALAFFAHDFLHAPRGDFIMQENRRDLFLDHVRDWLAENWEVAIFCNNEGEQKRLEELLREARLPVEGITFWQRPLLRGFVWPAGKLVVLSDAEIFGRYQTLRSLRKRNGSSACAASTRRSTSPRSPMAITSSTSITASPYIKA
jgi:transcription-repair coupling factor (superfamily II helicase)